MKSTYKRLALGTATLILAACAAVATALTDPGDLVRPVAVVGASARADGGTMEVQLLGANGKKLSIVREGSLETPRADQPMYLVNYAFGVVPFRRSVEKNSLLANDSEKILESWLHDKLNSEQRSKLLKGDQSTLREIPMDVLIVFDLMYWIGERRR